MAVKKGSEKARAKVVIDEELLSLDDEIANVALEMIDSGFSAEGMKELDALREKRHKLACKLPLGDQDPMPLREYLQKNP